MEHRQPRRNETATPQPAARPDDEAVLAAAFRELHGARLLGFAILVTLGDRQSAETVAGFALAAGAGQVAALRHPERAAAWLRARTLRSLHQRRSLARTDPTEVRRATLASIGVDAAAFSGLAALSLDARAALVASSIEGFDPIDVETILEAAPATARRLVAEARGTFLRNAGPTSADPNGLGEHPDGDLALRVQAVAARAFSSGDPAR